MNSLVKHRNLLFSVILFITVFSICGEVAVRVVKRLQHKYIYYRSRRHKDYMDHVNFYDYLEKEAKRGKRMREEVVIAGKEMKLLRKNANLVYNMEEVIPGAGVWRFKINSHGFRDDDFSAEKPPGTYRILFIGGSTTMWGSKNDTTVPALIEKRIEKDYGKSKIEILNLGIPHNTSTDSLYLFKNLYLNYSPDMVVVYHFFNDLLKYTPVTYVVHEKIYHSMLLGSLNDLYLEWFGTGLTERYLIKAKYAIKAYTLKHFNEFHELSKKHNFKLILSTFAQPDVAEITEYEYDYFDFDIKLGTPYFLSLDVYYQADNLFNREFKEFCREKGIVYTDVDAAVKGGLNYFTDVCHMTDEGNVLKSEATYKTIKKFLPAE